MIPTRVVKQYKKSDSDKALATTPNLQRINFVDQNNIQQEWKILRDNNIIIELQRVPFKNINLFRHSPWFRACAHRAQKNRFLTWNKYWP